MTNKRHEVARKVRERKTAQEGACDVQETALLRGNTIGRRCGYTRGDQLRGQTAGVFSARANQGNAAREPGQSAALGGADARYPETGKEENAQRGAQAKRAVL